MNMIALMKRKFSLESADEEEDGDSADEDEDGAEEIKGGHPASGGSAATSHACKLILLQCNTKTISRLVCLY